MRQIRNRVEGTDSLRLRLPPEMIQSDKARRNRTATQLFGYATAGLPVLDYNIAPPW